MLRKGLSAGCRVVAASVALAVSAGGMVQAAEGPKPLPEAAAKVKDVRLAQGGVLELQLVDQQGNGIGNVPVRLSFSGQAVAEGQSDDRGTVRFSSLRPGLHQVHAGGATDTVRLWNDGTAPPQAVRRLAIVASEQVVRAQSPMNTVGLGGMSGGNLVLGVVTVTSATLGIVAISENQDLQDDVDDLQSQLDELASP